MQCESNSNGSCTVLLLTCSLMDAHGEVCACGVQGGELLGTRKETVKRIKGVFLEIMGKEKCGICKVEGSRLREREMYSGCGAWGNFFFWEACRPSGGFSAGVASKVKPIPLLAVTSDKKIWFGVWFFGCYFVCLFFCCPPPVSVSFMS